MLAIITLTIASAHARLDAATTSAIVHAYSTTGPFEVDDGTDSFAIKGYTYTAANATGVIGFGGNASATNATGVTGYVTSPASVGVTGYAASTGTNAYGVYGYSATGNGVYGVSASGSVASIYGYNTASGGTGVYGYSTGGNGVLGSSTVTNGVVGMTSSSAAGHLAGVLGEDTSTITTNYGVYGTTATGIGVEGVATGAGNGGYFASRTSAGTGGVGYVGAPTGEGAILKGYSGNSSHPALAIFESTASTDLLTTYNTSSAATFITQAGTLNYSTYARSGGSDVQISGDLYVQGNVYSYCSSNSGTFPVTSSTVHGHCNDSPVNPTIAQRNSSGGTVSMFHASQSAPSVEDFGEAQLVNGQASVLLDRSYASTIDQNRSYLVFITPEGENRGLYVAAKSLQRFVIREAMGGHSTLAFQYRIVAHPYTETITPQVSTNPRSNGVAPITPRMPASGPSFSRAVQEGITVGPLPKRLPLPHVSLNFKH